MLHKRIRLLYISILFTVIIGGKLLSVADYHPDHPRDSLSVKLVGPVLDTVCLSTCPHPSSSSLPLTHSYAPEPPAHALLSSPHVEEST